MNLNTTVPSADTEENLQLRASDRVAGVLSDRIRSGLYNNGDILPSERALAADLRVHRRSVRTAIDRLVRDGVITRKPNCRPTVGHSSAQSPERTGRKSAQRISTSNLIALIMWHGGGPLEHAGTSQQRIFWGMNQYLTKIGYHAVFLDLGDRVRSEDENAAHEAEHLRYVWEQGFGGALFYPYAYRRNLELVKEVSRNVPLVLLDRKIAGVDLDFVGIQNHGAVMQITQHLIAQGHQRIAHLTRIEPIESVQDRVQGYLDAMREATPNSVTEMVICVPPYDDDRAWIVVDALFRLPKDQRPTAAVCVSDYIAVSFAERLKYLGLNVPADVAITGFDDIVPALPDDTGLTTVAQPYEEIGTTAIELVMRRIKDRTAPPLSIELPARVILRASSGS